MRIEVMSVKKLLTAILIIGSVGWVHADIAVTPGSGKTVGTFTDAASREIQQTSSRIDGSSNTVIVSSMGVLDVAGTSRPLGYGVQYSSMPVNVLNTLTVNTHAVTQSGTWTTGISGSVVVSSFAATSTPMVNVTQIGTTTVLTGGTAGSLGIGGLAAAGATVSGNPLPQALFVSSTSVPTTRNDTQAAYWTGTNIGQGLVTGVPWGLITVTTAIITTDTTERVLIASAAANTYTYLCGCVITNTSAINATVTLRRRGPAADVKNITIGAPANFIPAGIWPGCTNPFFRSEPASNITIQGSASISSLEVRCQSYVGP